MDGAGEAGAGAGAGAGIPGAGAGAAAQQVISQRMSIGNLRRDGAWSIVDFPGGNATKLGVVHDKFATRQSIQPDRFCFVFRL